MDEKEWLTSDDPQSMLEYLNYGGGCPFFESKGPKIANYPSDRKLRLFACACCRQIWHLLTDKRSQNAVEISERFADGMATTTELASARDAARNATWDDTWVAAWVAAWDAAWDAARIAACDAARNYAWVTARDSAWDAARDSAKKTQASILRDIVGNPFLPVTLPPPQCYCGQTLAWCDSYKLWYCDKCEQYRPVSVPHYLLTSDVLSLANTIYDDHDFVLMPILADALEDAGCQQEEILHHCRDPGTHARGCWCLDLILGKE